MPSPSRFASASDSATTTLLNTMSVITNVRFGAAVGLGDGGPPIPVASQPPGVAPAIWNIVPVPDGGLCRYIRLAGGAQAIDTDGLVRLTDDDTEEWKITTVNEATGHVTIVKCSDENVGWMLNNADPEVRVQVVCQPIPAHLPTEALWLIQVPPPPEPE
ncbi:hypothetical protein BD779DRAFT_1676657 [Infundibulicybe gibba]|nr:hypothetical protein BD779DRAFT_1676657 [Infundibulicybe gibba]